MAREKGSNKGFLVLCAVIVGGLYLVGHFSGDRNAGATPAKVAENDCGGGPGMAFVMSQNFVRERLQAPSTAQFPHTSNTTEIGPCEYRVAAYVDAQNAFGAMLRSDYTATMKYVGDRRWTARDVRILD